MLQELREIPSDVLAIILEHHENALEWDILVAFAM